MIHRNRPWASEYAQTKQSKLWVDPFLERFKALRRGWYLGSESFKREALARMEGSLGGHHAGELHQEVARAKAERIVAEELQRHGWQEQDLVTRRKNDPAKLEIAARLRRETTLSLKAIATRVRLGTSKTANAKLHKHMREASAGDSSQPTLGL